MQQALIVSFPPVIAALCGLARPVQYNFTLTMQGSTLVRRKILMTKVDPRTVRVKIFFNGRRPITQVFK